MFLLSKWNFLISLHCSNSNLEIPKIFQLISSAWPCIFYRCNTNQAWLVSEQWLISCGKASSECTTAVDRRRAVINGENIQSCEQGECKKSSKWWIYTEQSVNACKIMIGEFVHSSNARSNQSSAWWMQDWHIHVILLNGECK